MLGELIFGVLMEDGIIDIILVEKSVDSCSFDESF